MTVGEKIKTIRTFRGMTQRELGLAVGFPEKNADNRIAQYETDYRVPRKEMLDKIAFALHANCLNFYSIYERAGAAEDIMRTLFWLEESNMGRVQLVQTTPNTLPEKHDDRLRAIEDTTFHYNPSDDWPVCPPVAIYFDCIVDSFMREWLVRQQEYRAGEITKEEYFEWKLNWPDTCDDLGKATPNIQWRKNK